MGAYWRKGWVLPPSWTQCHSLLWRKAGGEGGWEDHGGVLPAVDCYCQQCQRLESGGSCVRASLGNWHWQDGNPGTSSGGSCCRSQMVGGEGWAHCGCGDKDPLWRFSDSSQLQGARCLP